ncbi:MAG: cyclophilin-like fold protein [Thermofilaceae archaeon]
MRIKLVFERSGTVIVELTGRNPRTAEALLRALPFESRARRWGEEVYFESPVDAGEEDASELVEVGDVAYWPPGRALCLFFGPTPISRPGEIRPASSVNVIGRVVEGLDVLRRVSSGERVRVEVAEG